MPRKKTPNDPDDVGEPDVTGHRHTICLDWDGTLVPSAWPERPIEWMPGAVEAVKDMLSYAHVVVFSARTRREDPATGEKLHPDDVQEEIDYIRRMLDREGLTAVGIWTRHGKPTASVYVDDKAERYNGRAHSWIKMRRKLRTRLGEPTAPFPPWEKGLA